METFTVPVVRGIDATARVPGSKSLANRALLCAALATGPSRLSGMPDGDDTSALIEALTHLGVGIERVETGDDMTLSVTRPLDCHATAEVRVNARLAGTTSRFLAALVALRAGPTIVDGEEPLRRRPIGDLLDALVSLGAVVECLDEPRSLPVRIQRGVMSGGVIALPGSVSSQFISALAMIAPYLDGGLTITIEGEPVSESYVSMTIDTMTHFGVLVSREANRLVIPPGRYTGCAMAIDPDASSATYPAAAAALAGGTVRLVGLARSTKQPDSAFPGLLARMGCRVDTDGDDVLVARDRETPLTGISVDMRDMSDAVPALAVVAACASTKTVISGVGFIRGKESDRLGDLAHELRVLGATVEVLEDGLSIEPSILHGGRVGTHHDHRLAMSLALIGLRVEGVSIENPAVVTKSWPGFWTSLERWTR